METRIKSLTWQGLGRTEDGQYLPRVLPGEVVDVGEGTAFRIITPSADRIAAVCRHYKGCGGCSMQHAGDDYIANWKTDVVARALDAQGIEAEVAGVETSTPGSRRRAKFAGRRTKSGALVGFHGRASEVLTQVPDCLLVMPQITAGLPALEALTLLAASRKTAAALTVTQSEAGLDVMVDTEKQMTPELESELPALAAKYKLARISWNGEVVATLNAPYQTFGAAKVVPPPGAFLQATGPGEAALLAHIRTAVSGAAKVVDLFAGCGTFALPLAEDATVHAVEGDSAMIAALDLGWRQAQGLKTVTSEVRDLFRRPLLPDELRAYGAAVIDPPRAGAQAQIETLATSQIPVIAMVSCNAVTFARDAKTLVDAGYTAGPITIIDQFRWSAHVELVSQFTLR